MSVLEFFNQWWNLPYLVMLGLAGLYFAAQTVGLTAGEGDADADVAHELDASPGEVHVEAHVDGGADGHDAAPDGHDAEGEAEAGFSFGALLGLGRVPFMVIWLSLFLFAGFGGLIANRLIWGALGRYPAWAFLPSFLGALCAGVAATRVIGNGVARLVDLRGRGSTARRELPGRPGVVASPVCDQEHGEIRVKDERGNEILVHARLSKGERALSQGEAVVLVQYDASAELYEVAALPEVPRRA